ncbi:glycosyltransferase family 2 protein [Variovorax ginsengisoli]|uniref:Glycosyltransferase involved in cell wall biosynthesis n=1 Tax=Variovorax ginsengisoli TaxID=363844 RepID=A0ABT9SB41_9BURK|nr:glycosyltransferase family 2 protein [Variovorax ginsengisoli]MDP9901572.1 glycosyltransferase involved in cell wall biosynthesis [Variovorax ginsengisoli]
MSESMSTASWRITRPLRAIARGVRLVSGIPDRLSAAVEHHGGMAGAARRAAELFRRGGWSGLVDALSPAADPTQIYRQWVSRYDTVDEGVRSGLRARLALMSRQPLITVLMPTYNPNAQWLSEAIESVRMQIYPNWELCIADDASPNEACREVLRKFEAMDSRIKVCYRQKNGHISAASNSALALATGEWSALLDHDDILPEQALFWVADAINAYPQARLIYSDEDKVDEEGGRFDAYFKPDWNVDLFYSQNMFSHLGVLQTALLREVGGFRLGMEGSQDYDLVLRCIERIQADQIVHIPRVLYHWRVHAESTAGSTDAKPYAQLAGERALNEHFQRRGIRGHVAYVGHGYRAHYDLPAVLPRVSLIIPTRNAAALVKQCVDSIEALTTYRNYEIILVDNGSDDPAALAYFAELALRPGYRLLRDDNEFNYSALNNRAVAVATGELVALINNDIEVVSPDWLSEMVSLALQPGVGAVGARLWYPDGTLQHGGVILGVGGIGSHSHKSLLKEHKGYFGRASLIQSFSAVTAACLVVRKASYQAVGGLDERHLKVAYNDVDFCLRLREAGLRNVWTPYAELIHHESATRGLDEAPEKKARFASEVDYMTSRWGTLLQQDPAYSPNLTLGADDFGLAWPPRIQQI